MEPSPSRRTPAKRTEEADAGELQFELTPEHLFRLAAQLDDRLQSAIGASAPGYYHLSRYIE